MSEPIARTLADHVASALHHVLTTVANDAAYSSGWLHRHGTLTGASFVQALVFASLDQPQVTTEALARMSGTVGTPVSGPGFVRRCTAEAVTLLKTVLASAVTHVIAAESTWVPLLQKVTGVYLLDSTVISLPEELQSSWRGCGGSGSPAAMKIQTVWDLRSGALAVMQLTDGRQHDSGSDAQWQTWPAGSVRVADLGYVNRVVLRRLYHAQVLVVSRLKVGTHITTRRGDTIDVLATMSQQPQAVQALPISIDGIPCRLVAYPATEQEIVRRRKRLKEDAQRRGQTISPAQRDWAAWNVVFTTATDEQLTTAEVIALLRARWQIELLFKLWKEHGHVDEVRSRNPWRIACEVLAKLIAVVIAHWSMLVTGWHYPNRSLRKMAQGIQSYAVALALARTPTAIVSVLTALTRSLVTGSRQNRRKAHPNTFQMLDDPASVWRKGTATV